MRWLAVAGWTAVILLASSDAFSARESGGMLAWLFGDLLSPAAFASLHFALRKLAHLVAYGILGALAFRASLRVDVALLIAVAVAVIDEVNQSRIPTRTGSGWDVALDLVGAMLAVAIYRRRV